VLSTKLFTCKPWKVEQGEFGEANPGGQKWGSFGALLLPWGPFGDKHPFPSGSVFKLPCPTLQGLHPQTSLSSRVDSDLSYCNCQERAKLYY